MLFIICFCYSCVLKIFVLQALALKFQEQERQLEDMKTMEREIREQRRLLELELHHETQTGTIMFSFLLI